MGLIEQYPKEYARYRSVLHEHESFRAYLRHQNVLPPLQPRPGGHEFENGRVMSKYTIQHLGAWPEGTVREVQFGETKKYKKEKRYVYTPTNHPGFHPPPPPPPPPPPAAASA